MKKVPITDYRLPFTLCGLLLTLFIFTAGVVSAQTGEVTDDQVNEVAKDLFCPVCESTPLDVCPTQACADWRELIRTQLAEGKTKDEVQEYFARQYGDGVLADPPKRGFNLILWVVPIVGVAVAGFFFMRYMRHLRQAGEEKQTMVTAVTPLAPTPIDTAVSPPSTTALEADRDYVARVEEELLAKK